MAQVNLEQTYNDMATMVQTAEANFDPAAVDPNDQRSMIQLQADMQKWTLATQMQSNTMKTVGESLKSIISNVR